MIDIEALHPTYRGFYEALGCNDEALMGVFKGMSGQQVNLPVHLYEPEAVKQRLSEQISKHQEIDINEMVERYGYSRRWIRSTIRDIRNEK